MARLRNPYAIGDDVFFEIKISGEPGGWSTVHEVLHSQNPDLAIKMATSLLNWASWVKKHNEQNTENK